MDISSMLEVQVKEETDIEETNIKENVTPGKDQASTATIVTVPPISQEESNFYKLMFGNEIAAVRFRRLHCTACDVHIGSAPAQIHNMCEHPVLRTLLCANCREFYGDGTFEQGDDATDMFCRWCANGGNLYCCSYCSNTFCYKCIRRNFTSLVRKKIEGDDKWKCFVCNPSDLYSARAVCWALFQHIETVTRILVHNKKMDAEEVEEKMNLDESPCCPRRGKRKRRRLDSNSEEEDETYTPKPNGMPGRKQLRKIRPISQSANGIVTRELKSYTMPIPIRPRPASFLTGQSFNQLDVSQSAASNNSIVNSAENIVLPSPMVRKLNASLPSRSSVYHSSFMNTSGSSAYVHGSVAMNPPTRIILPPQPQPQLTSYQPQQTSSYQSSQSLQSAPNTMVSIPNPTDNHGRSMFLRPKSKELDKTVTPNIIELDSDSDDELRIVTQQNNSTVDGGKNMGIINISPNKVVPVALTWENSDDDDDTREQQPLTEIRSTVEKDVSFDKMMLPHTQELDKLLSDMKEKVFDFFDLNNAVENIEVTAQQNIKRFYCNLRDTILQLLHINDRIVRQYVEWRRYRKTETEASSSTNKNALTTQETVEIPLDMTCINDSDTESNCESQKYQIMEPSDSVKDNNIVKDLLFCKTNVVHRGVGDDSAHLSVDKAIQVYDIVSRDYEKSIGYSVCTKTDNSKTNDSALDPVVTPDKNFGKYEEQFIFYLQHIEDNGIETEDTKSLADSDETSLQEVTKTNLPFVSHLSHDVDLPVVSIDRSENCQEEKNLSDNINSLTKDGESNTLDENDKEIVNFETKIQKTNLQPDDKLQQTESRETHADKTDGETMSDNNEANLKEDSNIINTKAVAPIENEDCTIIHN